MIQLSEVEKKEFIAQRYQDFDFESFEINQAEFAVTLGKELESYLNLSKTEKLQSWFENVNIPNTIVEDFKERIFETKSGKVMMGIRFLGMDLAKPFINIWASFPLEKELENIKDFARNSFAVFKPKHIKFWANPNSDLTKQSQKYICQNYLVGNINEIVNSAKPNNYENIDLELVINVEVYEWYVKIYNEFHQENPNLKSFVMPNSIDIMQDSIKQNLCYFIKYNGEKIGLIAAEKDAYFGVPSLYMNEIIISKEFKGKKLATAAQRKLIALNKKDFTFIWGTIDQKNIPSTKNALRIGRKVISSELLLPI